MGDRARTLLAAASLLLLLLPRLASAIDLTGIWRVEYGDTSAAFTDLIQTGTSVTLSLPNVPGLPPGPYLLTGSFDEGQLELELDAPDCDGEACSLRARVLADGDHFDGRFDTAPIFSPVVRVLANRCECFDGNMLDGDGCDATCRVEPCFTCNGLSLCTPVADGGACDDRSPCTTGETCSAGLCTGAPVQPCVDLNGVWDTVSLSELGYTTDAVVRIEQRDTVVLVRDDLTGRAQHLGTITPATGDFSLLIPHLAFVFCNGFDFLTGTAVGNGLVYDALGISSGPHQLGCLGFGYTQTGTRRCPGSPGCPPPAPTLPPVAGLALGGLLAWAARARLRRRTRAAW